MLRIVSQHQADTAILQCFGRIVAGPEAEALKDAVACAADKNQVILDLAGVAAIDARGLGRWYFFKPWAAPWAMSSNW